MPDILAASGAAWPSGLEPTSPTPSAPNGAPSIRDGGEDRSPASLAPGAGERRPSSDAPPSFEFTGQVPTDITGYRLSASEALTPYLAGLDADEAYNAARAFAQRANLTDQQFDAFVRPTMEFLARQVAADGGGGPQDFTAEIERLIPPEAVDLDDAGRRAAVARRVGSALDFVEGAKGQGLDAEVAEFLVQQLGDDARGIRALEWMRALGPSTGGQGGSMSLTDRIIDPRNDPRNKRFDPAFAAETDRLSRAQFPERPQANQAPPSPRPGTGNGGGSDPLAARLSDPRNDPRSPKFDRGFAAETDRLYQRQYGW